MGVSGRMMIPDWGGGSVAPDRVVDEAQNVQAVLDDIRALATRVDETLQDAGEGTVAARQEVDLGSPSDQIAQDTVAVAGAAQAVYRESVQYLLESLENYRDALLASVAQYASSDEGIDEDLRMFSERVEQAQADATYGEQQAAGGYNGYSGSGSGGSGSGGSGSGGSGSSGSGGSDGGSTGGGSTGGTGSGDGSSSDGAPSTTGAGA